jgi:hypothetical protein
MSGESEITRQLRNMEARAKHTASVELLGKEISMREWYYALPVEDRLKLEPGT